MTAHDAATLLDEPPMIGDESQRIEYIQLNAGLVDDRGWRMIELGEVFRVFDPLPVETSFVPGWSGNAVLFTSPAITRQLFQQAPGTVDFESSKAFLRFVMGSESPFLLDGDDHLAVRRALLAVLSVSNVERYRERSVEVLDQMIDDLPIGVPVKLHDLYARFAQDLILRTTFGMESGWELEWSRRLLHAVTENIIHVGKPSALMDVYRPLARHLPPNADSIPWIFWPRPAKDQISRTDGNPDGNPDHSRARQRLGIIRPPTVLPRGKVFQLLGDLLIRRKVRQLRRDPNDSIASRLISRAGEESWSDKRLRDCLATLMLAGQETSISAYKWASEYVMHDDNVRQRLVTEALSGTSDRYARAVNTEALRLKSPVWGVQALAKRDFELGGHRISKGTWLFGVTTALHHQPDDYPEPQQFKPERFLEKAPERYSFVAFGEGRHRCPGSAFYYAEAGIVLHRVFGRLDLEPCLPAVDETRMSHAYFNHPLSGTEVIVHGRRRANEVPVFRPGASELPDYERLHGALLPAAEETTILAGGNCPFSQESA